MIALDSLEARLGEMMNWRDLSRIVPPDLQKPFKRAAREHDSFVHALRQYHGALAAIALRHKEASAGGH